MITNGKRTIFVYPTSEHRKIKDLSHQFSKMIPEGKFPTQNLVDSYHYGVKNYKHLLKSHLNELCIAFRTAFNNSNYRRTSEAKIKILEEYKATARAKSTDGIVSIEISFGLLYAVEDLWQCVISDNHTDLHAYCGVSHNAPNVVLRDIQNFHTLDKYRFYDYDFIDELCYKPLLSNYNLDLDAEIQIGKIHNYLVSKMVSLDDRRVNFGNYLSDISIYWILAHEDAHIYFGHAKYFNESLGISADELENINSDFLKLHNSYLKKNNTEELKNLRVIAELQADELACTRMIDYLLDDETFDLYPPLRGSTKYLTEVFDNYDQRIPENESKFVAILRVAISSAISSTLLFYRNVEKNDITAITYPNIDIRISNIIISSIFRAYTRLNINESSKWTTFDPLSHSGATMLSIGISNDIKVLTWNLLSHPRLLKDPDLPPDKELKFSQFEEKLPDGSDIYQFVIYSIYYVLELFDTGNSLKIANYAVNSKTLYNVLSLQAQYFDKSSNNFKEIAIADRPHMRESYNETYHGIENQSNDLKKILHLANIILRQ